MSPTQTARIEREGDDISTLLAETAAMERRAGLQSQLQSLTLHWQAAGNLAARVSVASEAEKRQAPDKPVHATGPLDVAEALLRYLLRPGWWEHGQADQTRKSVVHAGAAGRGDGQAGAAPTPASREEVRARHRSILTTSLWLECIGASSQASRRGWRRDGGGMGVEGGRANHAPALTFGRPSCFLLRSWGAE